MNPGSTFPPAESPASHQNSRPHSKAKANPLQSATTNFLLSRGTNPASLQQFSLPKRYTVYPPLLLLPANFGGQDSAWRAVYTGFSEVERRHLFSEIVSSFKRLGVSHVAINAPIVSDGGTEGNVMRSPSGLVPVYGDFGPNHCFSGTSKEPKREDFERAFWVEAVQNGGIVQTWAPLWTMFSRGNVSEKARILEGGGAFMGMVEEELGQGMESVDVVDFYVGIGYFAFSYLRAGMGRVWGWEINGWSVEALRRGCERNGWDCSVVRLSEYGNIEEAQVDTIVKAIEIGEDKRPRCTVFHGDNKGAAKVMNRIRARLDGSDAVISVRHANLGLLPTSRASWEDAVGCLDRLRGGWLHVHENVDVNEIDKKREEVLVQIKQIVDAHRKGPWTVWCCHVEQVKTFAPGVMHCVFDVQISPAR